MVATEARARSRGRAAFAAASKWFELGGARLRCAGGRWAPLPPPPPLGPLSGRRMVRGGAGAAAPPLRRPRLVQDGSIAEGGQRILIAPEGAWRPYLGACGSAVGVMHSSVQTGRSRQRASRAGGAPASVSFWPKLAPSAHGPPRNARRGRRRRRAPPPPPAAAAAPPGRRRRSALLRALVSSSSAPRCGCARTQPRRGARRPRAAFVAAPPAAR